MASESCDHKSVYVKYDNNHFVCYDGQIYETSMNTVTRKDIGSVLDVQVGLEMIVNNAKISGAKGKGRTSFGIVVEPPNADLGFDPGSEIKPTSSACVTRKSKSVSKVTITKPKKRGMDIANSTCAYVNTCTVFVLVQS